ncbi:MAG: creatininase family protein, partial [Armatimonadota bacterium]
DDLRIIHADGPLLSEEERMPRQVHASSGETGAMLSIRPDLVKGRSPDHSAPFGQEWLDYAGMGALTETGTWGEPSKADPEAYEENIQAAVEHRVQYIRETFERLDEVLGPIEEVRGTD